jgi:hypothetical protein
MEHTLDIAERVGASVVDIAEDVLEDVGEFIKHNEKLMGNFLDEHCMAIRPLIYIREAVGTAIDDVLAPLTQR